VLDTVPKKHQLEVKAAVQAIVSEDNLLREATTLRDAFARPYRRAHPNAVERLAADWTRMVTYTFRKNSGSTFARRTLSSLRSRRSACAPRRRSVSRKSKTRRP